jgi:hypothetical protein
MALTINLTPELGLRLAEAAAQEGVPESDYLLRLLNRHLPQADHQRAGIALLQSWIDGDVTDEGDAESEAILRALDEHRESERKLYPAM